MSVTFLGRVFMDDLPERPDWHRDAACRGKHSPVDGEDMFFDYGRSEQKISRARRVCRGCPVRAECLRDNIEVPYGMFGGYTETERFDLLHRSRPTRSAATKYFSAYNGYGRRDRAG